ncbi:MAG: transglutaminase domain-containing protein, partial [Actinobacteria bacterium]|nr:transglutaminase domain-containing protein [Actinomycetota bacterium]
MASRRDAPALALAVLSSAAALSFGRVFRGGAFALPVIGAAIIPHAIGLLGRRRRWPVAATVAASIAALALYVCWFLVPSTTGFGIPGTATLHEIGHRFSEGWRVYRTGHSPVAVTGGPVLLCVFATWIAAQCAELLAFRRDATVGTIVPGLVLFILAATLGTSSLRSPVTLAFGAAAVVFLLFQQQVLLERRRAWFTGRSLGSRGSLLRTGSAIGIVTVVAGLALAPVLPGADARAWFNYRKLGAGTSGGPSRYDTISPLVDIKDRLDGPNSRLELFTVKAPKAAYWRLAALDTFDGEVWGINTKVRDVRAVLPSRNTSPAAFPQTVAIKALDQQFLPAAYDPKAIDLDAARIVPESGTIISDSSSLIGKRYTVWSEPTAAPTVVDTSGASTPPTSIIDRYAVLPNNFPPVVSNTARAVTRGAVTPLEKAQALQQFFLDNFTYRLDVPRGHNENAMVSFLESRAGFCEQFAGTYAAMARVVGLPSRVAVGFTQGTLEADGLYHVEGIHAHAWPEVWLDGRWVQFEPTPAGPLPGQPQAGDGAGSTATTTPTTAGTIPPSQGNQSSAGSANGLGDIKTTPGPNGSSGGGSNAGWIAAVAIGAAALAAGAAYPTVVLVAKARRRRRRRAGDPAAAVSGAWQEVLDRLDEAG